MMAVVLRMFVSVLCAVGLLLGQSEALVRQSAEGRRLMGEARFADAVAVYEELVKALPADVGLRMNLGMAQHLAGAYPAAIGSLKMVLKTQPGALPALMMLSASYLKTGQPGEAAPLLRKALAQDASLLDARRMLADAAAQLDRHEEAAAQLRKILEAQPGEARGWYSLGLQYEALAAGAFGTLQKVAPGSGYVAALIADSRTRGKQTRAAFYFYREALKREPKLRGAHAAVAQIYKQTGHEDWSAEELRAEGNPNCAVEKAACDFAAGRYLAAASGVKTRKTPEDYYWQARAWSALASAAFGKLVALPDSAPKLQLMAEMLRGQGQYMEAVAQWRAALALAPGDVGLERELAATLCLAKDFDQAEPLLKRLLAADVNSAALNFLLGDSYLARQRPEEAVPLLEKAVAVDPKLLPARASLARAYLAAGAGEKAVPQLKEALPLDEDGSLHFQLARAYQASGQAELAKQLLAKYQELKKRSEAAQTQLEQDAQISAPAK
ncbi:MAG: tetratricopeptide repeat protein [Bryobacteraceae bacterium]